MPVGILIAILGIWLVSCNNHSEKEGKFDSLGNTTRNPYNRITSNTPRNTSTDSLPFSNRVFIMMSSGQFSPTYPIIIDGCKFDAVLTGHDTTFLSTTDETFRTSEGYEVGMTLSQLPKTLQGKLQRLPGWGYYLKLSSGWYLGFCEGSSCTDQYPKANSEVKWIFK